MLPRTRTTALTEREAQDAFMVLCRYGQADWGDSPEFIRYATEGLDEWRFIGSLGFGGKIRCLPDT